MRLCYTEIDPVDFGSIFRRGLVQQSLFLLFPVLDVPLKHHLQLVYALGGNNPIKGFKNFLLRAVL